MGGVNVEYIYSYISTVEGKSPVIVKVTDTQMAVKLLEGVGVLPKDSSVIKLNF